jgi:hypothetical protein
VALSPVTGRLVRRQFVTEALTASVRAVADGGLVVRRPLAAELDRGKFVGRINELKRLGAILATATRNQPQIVVLRGETGLGKSRLLAEAKRRLERGRFNVAFYNATCPANGASVPWSGLRAMLHVLCGTQEDDDPERILEVKPRLRALALRDDESAAVLGLLGAHVVTKESEARGLVRASFERMVHSLCHDQLHCFTWDDAQAIDRETLEAILRVLSCAACSSWPCAATSRRRSSNRRTFMSSSSRSCTRMTLASSSRRCSGRALYRATCCAMCATAPADIRCSWTSSCATCATAAACKCSTASSPLDRIRTPRRRARCARSSPTA